MAIESIVQPYEILIRFKEGVVVGSHFKTIEVVRDDERVYSATESRPQPIGDHDLSGVLGDALHSALKKIDLLEGELDRANRAIEDMGS